jgi:glutaconate CoA-transferase subunit A
MKNSKLMALKDMIARFVADGSSIALGTAQETMIPFAAGFEIMRQRKQNLTLIGPISDILFDQLVGAGCVAKIRAAWVGNVITGSGYNFRRAIESGAVEIEDHSNLTLAMALHAGALGVPFLPTYTAQGSHLFKSNRNLRQITCPFSDQKLTAVAAINPDLAIIHVQQADEEGNALVWGNLGMTREACLAAAGVIITCEEVVSSQITHSDPNRIITPAFRVRAVAQAPWGAYPSPLPGYYNRDHQAFLDYHEVSSTEPDFQAWLYKWVDALQDHHQYIHKVGAERLDNIRIKIHSLSTPVDYGY